MFFGEPAGRSRILAVIIAFLGCALISNPFATSGGVPAIGMLLGLGAAAGYANFTILSHRLLETRSRSALMTYMFAFTAVMAAVIAIASGESLSVAAWTSQLWLLLGLIIAIPTLAAITLYFTAMRHLGPAQAAILSSFEPIFTIALAALLLGESLEAVQWIGAALVISGVLIAELGA